METHHIYLGLLASLAIALVGFPETGKRFVLCPSWCPPSILLSIVHLGKWVAAAAALALSLAAAFPDKTIARLVAAVCFSIFAFQHHATVGTHYEQLALWGLWALVLPSGPTRGSMLHVIVAHHIGAAGMLKVFVGGAAWAERLTMAEMSKEFAPSAAVLNFVETAPSVVMFMLGWGGLVAEALVFPVAVLHIREPQQGAYLLGALIAFHVGTFVLVSMFFVHNVPIYAAALLLDPPKHIEQEAWVLLGILCLITAVAVEDWPFSHMGLFPYSGTQLRNLSRQFGGQNRLIGAVGGKDGLVRKELRDSGAVDIIAWALHASVPTSALQWEGDGRFGVATFWAKSWLDINKLDLSNDPRAAVAEAARSLGEKQLIWDTTLEKPLSNFYVVKLGQVAKRPFVIEEIHASMATVDETCSGESKTKKI